MTTILLPPDLEESISDQARRRGTSIELLAIKGLRELYPSERTIPVSPSDVTGIPPRNLLEFLGEFVGCVEGNGEPLSENTGKYFTDELVKKHEAQQK